MRIVISCGGTGGHIIPALAIADTVKQNCREAEILFVGSERGMENSLVPQAGYALKTLSVQGLRRSLSPANLQALWKAARAMTRARSILGAFLPDMVIGTGGYACYPTVRAAAAMGIPTAVHESNAVPGLAVKRLAGRVDRVWLNFSAAAKDLPKGSDTLTVGNPLRYGASVSGTKRVGGRSPDKTVLSFGGSLGAREMNKAVLSLMLAEQGIGGIRHLHATGKAGFDAVWREFCALGLDRDPRFTLVPFIHDMPSRMAEADLVISRAGAMSISELAAMGCAAILIPSPNVTGNHQYKNARMLADAGAARLLTEEMLVQDALIKTVLSLLQNEKERQALSNAIGAFAIPDANRRIYEDMKRLMRR